MRGRIFAAGMIATLVSATTAAQGQTGDQLLTKGLSGRITPLTNGVTINRVGNRPDAGYFVVEILDNQSSNAAICPKKAFGQGQGKRWRKLNDRIYDEIFERRGLWGINASFKMNSPGGEVNQEVRLISVKNPQESDCIPYVLGTDPAGTKPQFRFITPINARDYVYGSGMVVTLKSVHERESSKERVDNLWAGLGFFAKVISAPLAPLVESLAGEGKKEVTEALNKVGGEAHANLLFDANPDGLDKTQSQFVYLGFESFGQTGSTALTGGVTLRGNYQASVLVPRVRYFSEIAAAPTPEDVIKATPLRDAAGVLQNIRDRLGAKAFNLAAQATPDAFSGICTVLQPDILALGLSEVDADLWLWAMAKTSTHKAVSENLDKIGCFGATARANLKRVGNIAIEPPPPLPIQLRPARFAEMQPAMENLGTMTTQGAVIADLTGRFAEKIDVSIVEDTLGGAGAALNGGSRDRAVVLDFMVRNFSRYGCYSPRNDTTNYQLRPFMPLKPGGRAGAMMLHDKKDTPYIVTFGFDGVPKDAIDAKALISAIAIQKQGSDTGDVVQDLAAGSSPICPKLPAR